MIFRLLLLCLLSSLSFISAQAQTRRAQPVEVDRIVAVVNDEAITAFELRARLATVERQLRGQNVQLPPRDVLAKADPAGVAKETTALLDAMPDKSRVVFSCGGGMPPGVSTANVNAFIDAVRNHPASKG